MTLWVSEPWRSRRPEDDEKLLAFELVAAPPLLPPRVIGPREKPLAEPASEEALDISVVEKPDCASDATA
ncbi:MAG TPA: hypothetical protein PLL22_08445, partial [Microbacteriaceae bacterium]|nr:hypothetical protein [Microbacteriaceae bacterium]